MERNESRIESVPGVAVVKLTSKEDKRNILRVKANLMETHRYRRVSTHPDMSKRERQLAANFRKVQLGCVRQNGFQRIITRLLRINHIHGV